jgi:hypothetical protein
MVSRGRGKRSEVGKIEKDDATNTTSIRSDRRFIRLMIPRYWADRLIKKYNKVQKEKDGKEDMAVKFYFKLTSTCIQRH